jgi:hypothetical protein
LLNRVSQGKNQRDLLEVIEFIIEFIVLPPTETYYYCKSFKIPEAYEKRHIVEVKKRMMSFLKTLNKTDMFFNFVKDRVFTAQY